MKKFILLSGLFLLSLLSCNKSDSDLYEDSLCDEITIVDNSRYKNLQSQSFSIRSAEVKGDCLELEIESSGCSGETWKVDLMDSGGVAESLPEQRYLKVSLTSEELCNALVTKTYTFDLRPVRTRNDVVLLNLDRWEEQIRYEY